MTTSAGLERRPCYTSPAKAHTDFDCCPAERMTPAERAHLQQLGRLSAILWADMLKRRLSFAQVDKLARVACGRKWCDFENVADYESTIRRIRLP